MLGNFCASVLQASIFAVACICTYAGEIECPIGSDGPECEVQPLEAGSRAGRRDGSTEFVAFPGEPARHLAADTDLITQEVQELEAMIALSNEKIQLLETLQQAVEPGSELPAAHTRAVQQILDQEVPLVSDSIAEEDVLPTAPAEDYLVSKAIIRQHHAAAFIAFLPLRAAGVKDKAQPRWREAMAQYLDLEKVLAPSALLVSAATDGTAWLYAPSGELLLTFHTGHEHPVTHLAASGLQDQYLIATSDAGGFVRLHNVKVRDQRPITASDQRELQRQRDRREREIRRQGKKPRRQKEPDPLAEKDATYLGSTTYGAKLVNVTVQFQRQVEVSPGHEHGNSSDYRVTAVAMLTKTGSKYLVVGDAQGKISVFGKRRPRRKRRHTRVAEAASVNALPSGVLRSVHGDVRGRGIESPPGRFQPQLLPSMRLEAYGSKTAGREG